MAVREKSQYRIQVASFHIFLTLEVFDTWFKVAVWVQGWVNGVEGGLDCFGLDSTCFVL